MSEQINYLQKLIMIQLLDNTDSNSVIGLQRKSIDINLSDLCVGNNEVDKKIINHFDDHSLDILHVFSEMIDKYYSIDDIKKYNVNINYQHLDDYIYSIFEINLICNICGQSVTIYNSTEFNKEKNSLISYINRKIDINTIDDERIKKFACCKKYYITNRKSVNKLVIYDICKKEKIQIVNNSYGVCKNKHKFRIKGGLYNYSIIPNLECRICKQQVEQKFELFKILNEMNCNFYIKEEFKIKDSRCKPRKHASLKILSIYTYNDKKHLTGHICFDDSFGEHSIRASKNNLVFRWFDVDNINNREFCIKFLEEYFKEIVSKHQL